PTARTVAPDSGAPSAEAAETTAEPPEQPPAASGDDQTVIDSWPAVVDLIRADNQMLAALLAEARPVSADERALVLAFPAGAAFLKRKAEQDDHRRVAADALQTVTGRRLSL